jgi:hypothetical protein
MNEDLIMQCDAVRTLLPLHVYGDLADSERMAIEGHLTGCLACQQDLAEFQRLRETLSALPAPERHVDVGQIYSLQTLRRRKQTRRWQMAALAAIAVTVFVLFMRLEIQVNAGQLVIRWGRPEPIAVVEKPAAVPAPAPAPAEPNREMMERLQVMNDLIHALADSIETGDRQRREDLQRLQVELAAIQRRSQRQFDETQNEVDALYTAQFGARAEDTKP